MSPSSNYPSELDFFIGFVLNNFLAYLLFLYQFCCQLAQHKEETNFFIFLGYSIKTIFIE
jgi:hypothetical protein